MRFAENQYNLLGLGLVLTGGGFAIVSYLILDSTPLTALGISMMIMGAICLTLGRATPRISPEVSAVLLETGLENTAAIVEELGLRSKAIYLPPSFSGGHPRALIPLHSNPGPYQIQIGEVLPGRLIAKYGPAPEDIGILVATPGSSVAGILGAEPGPSVDGLEASLTSALVGMLDVADGATVKMTGESVFIEVANPRLEQRNLWFYQLLGSPLASVVASLAAEALGRPLIVEREAHRKGKLMIELRVVD